MVVVLLVLPLQLLLLALEAGVYVSNEGGALLSELGDVWVPLVLLVGVSLVLCIGFLLPTGRVGSGRGYEARYCSRAVAVTVGEGILGGLQECQGSWHVLVAA